MQKWGGRIIIAVTAAAVGLVCSIVGIPANIVAVLTFFHYNNQDVFRWLFNARAAVLSQNWLLVFILGAICFLGGMWFRRRTFQKEASPESHSASAPPLVGDAVRRDTTNQEPKSDVRIELLRGIIAGHRNNSIEPTLVALEVRVAADWKTRLHTWKLSIKHGDTFLTANLDFTPNLKFSRGAEALSIPEPSARFDRTYFEMTVPIGREVDGWLVFAVLGNSTVSQEIYASDLKLSVVDDRGIEHWTEKRPSRWITLVQRLAVTPTQAIVSRGWVAQRFGVPVGGEVEITRTVVEAHTIAIRNVGTNDVHSLVANIDFLDASGAVFAVNEAWWVEDDRDTGTLTLAIGRGETMHLVVVATVDADQSAFGLPKIHSRHWGQFVVGEPVWLSAGRWKIKVDLIGDGLNYTLYSMGEIFSDGHSEWSQPSPDVPSGWA